MTDTNGEFSTLWLENNIDLNFAAGLDSVIRLEFVGGGFEVDSVEFAEPIQTTYLGQERTITADFTTTNIELEKFDVGGQGVAYFDDSEGNDSSSDYRNEEDVDTTITQLQGRVFDGEWLEYTTDIHAGEYDITLRKDWGGADSGVKLFIGDSNSATEFTQLGEFDFQTGDGNEFITLNDVDLSQWAGTDRVIRIEIIGNWMGLDNLELVSKTQTAPVVDISGLTLTQISPSQYSIDLSSVTTADGVYELKLNSSASGIQDLAGNALATNAMDQFVIDQVGPQVESVVVNGGNAQRSVVSEITVTFNEVVTGVDASSFILTNTTNNSQVIPTVTTVDVGGKTIVTLTFNGSGIQGGSLAMATIP